MLAVGNDELEGSVGRDILCDKCGEYHEIIYGERVLDDGTKEPCKMLAFYKCGDKTYLAGIDGKLIKGVEDGYGKSFDNAADLIKHLKD